MVKQQVNYILSKKNSTGAFKLHGPPKKVLVIGASTGYGLASRITSTFGFGAKTIGVSFEKAADGKRTATPGWYNTAAFEREAHNAQIYAKSINGDAYTTEIKKQTIALIGNDWKGGVDLVVYSLASPRRQDPMTGVAYTSVLKPIESRYEDKTVNVANGEVSQFAIEPATEQEIESTIKVMGGEDWQLWIEELLKENLLAKNAITCAYSYVGPSITHPIYRNGTIGRAKEHLEKTALMLHKKLASIQGSAYISVNKGLVTQASSAIPVLPLYLSLLYKVMKTKGLHEGCIEQIWRLFSERLYFGNQSQMELDKEHRIRIDDWEMRPDVQKEVLDLWSKVNTNNLEELSEINLYREEFYRLFGFKVPSVDYSKEVEINVPIPSLSSSTSTTK